MTASNSRLSYQAAVRRLSDPVAASQFQHLLFADRWDRREVVIVLAVGSKNSAELKVPHFTRFTAHWILPSQWVDFIRQPWRRRRDRLPTTSAQSNQSGFHSQIDRSGQPRDQQSQTSNCPGRADRWHQRNCPQISLTTRGRSSPEPRKSIR
jgi:hypothetical protein